MNLRRACSQDYPGLPGRTLRAAARRTRSAADAEDRTRVRPRAGDRRRRAERAGGEWQDAEPGYRSSGRAPRGARHQRQRHASVVRLPAHDRGSAARSAGRLRLHALPRRRRRHVVREARAAVAERRLRREPGLCRHDGGIDVLPRELECAPTRHAGRDRRPGIAERLSRRGLRARTSYPGARAAARAGAVPRRHRHLPGERAAVGGIIRSTGT